MNLRVLFFPVRSALVAALPPDGKNVQIGNAPYVKRMLSLGLALLLSSAFAHATEAPLRIFIYSGAKSHAPGCHDHPAFLRDWVPLLNERGAKASGGDQLPSAEEMDRTDVLLIHRDGGGDFSVEERIRLDAFTKRGGGIVVIHAGAVANTPEGTEYYKKLIGGSWSKGTTKWLEGSMNLYFTDRFNPITKDCSNFEMEDEIYYDMDLSPDIHVLAGAYTPKPATANAAKAKQAEASTAGGKKVSVYDIQPQVWTYERDGYRSFVCIPGHQYANFNRANFRALLLRGIVWAGRHAGDRHFWSSSSRIETRASATDATVSSRGSLLACSGGSLTCHFPVASAVVCLVCPANSTVTVALASAHPQTGTSCPRCRTMWSEKTEASFSSAACNRGEAKANTAPTIA